MTMASPEKNAVCQEIENNLKAMLMLTPSPPKDAPHNQHQSNVPKNTRHGSARHYKTFGQFDTRRESRQGTIVSYQPENNSQKDGAVLGAQTSRDRPVFRGQQGPPQWQGYSKKDNRRRDLPVGAVRHEPWRYRFNENSHYSEKDSSPVTRYPEKRYTKDSKNIQLHNSRPPHLNKQMGMQDSPPRFDKKKDDMQGTNRGSKLEVLTGREDTPTSVKPVGSLTNDSSHPLKNDSAKKQRRRARKVGPTMNGEIVTHNFTRKVMKDFIASQKCEKTTTSELPNCTKQDGPEIIPVLVVNEKLETSASGPSSCVRNFAEEGATEKILIDNLAQKAKKEKQKEEKKKPKQNKRDKPNNVQIVKEAKTELKSAEHAGNQKVLVQPETKHKAGKKVVNRPSAKVEAIDEVMPLYDAAVESFLKQEYIHPLKKKSPRFPRAHFFCRLCDYHCDDLESVSKHVSHQSHIMRKQLRKAEALLRKIPSPAQPHADVLSELVEKVAKENGLTPEDIELRNAVIEELNVIFDEKLPGCHVRLFGSSISGFGLKNSDVNIDLIVPAKQGLAKSLTAAFELVQECGKYADVKTDFGAKIPFFSFVDEKRKLYCEVSLNNSASQQTTQLLAKYSSYDPRAQSLGVAFRYWAKLCHIDQQKQGTMPAHSFPIMTVFFLQQCSPPVLPVLHEERKFECKNKMGLGELWLGLLKFYSIGFPCDEYVICLRVKKLLKRSEKNWNNKLLAIEDPFIPKRNIARTVSHQQVFRFIQERFCAAYLYFGVPQLEVGPLFSANELSTFPYSNDKWVFTEPPKESEKEQTTNNVTNTEENVDKTNEVEMESEGMIKQLQASSESEDEGVAKVVPPPNFGRQDSQPEQVDTADNEDDEYVKLLRDRHTSDTFDADSSSVSDIDDLLADHDPDTPIDQVIAVVANMALDDGLTEEIKKLQSLEGLEKNASICEEGKDIDAESTLDKVICTDEKTGFTLCEPPTLQESTRNSQLPLHIQEQINCVKKHELIYEFSESKASGGKTPPVLCQLCMKEGHLKQDCPDEKLPELIPLPEMTPAFLQQLDEVCGQIVRRCSPTVKEEEERESMLREVEKYIQELYPDARLRLFGSSCNGFGFSHSDMDICLTFEDNKTGEGIKQAAIIEALAEKLREHPSLHNVIPITTAKVPIVKFSKGRLDADISLYNTLAEHNTRMLRTYCQIDQRVKVLGYTLKYFAKVCDICDASRGSLSSYAYILMVLHFLQQATPPVIPVLQELHDPSKPRPEVMVDGWNAWFYDDNPNLHTVWPDYGLNSNSVGELWLQMLCYYTEKFEFSSFVVSIQQKAPLTRFEKLWNSKSIAIEDPFDLNHNLGAGVSRKMNTYIMKAFIKGRELFGTPIARNFIESTELLGFLFERKFLTDGSPPNDRGCRACGKIGHKVKECPRRRISREVRRERLTPAEARKQPGRNDTTLAPMHPVKDKGIRNAPIRQDRLPPHLKHTPPNLAAYFQCPRMKIPMDAERPLSALTLHTDLPRMASHLPGNSHIESPEKPKSSSFNMNAMPSSPPKGLMPEQALLYPRIPAPPGFGPSIGHPLQGMLHRPLLSTPPRAMPPPLAGSPPYKMQCVQSHQFASQFSTAFSAEKPGASAKQNDAVSYSPGLFASVDSAAIPQSRGDGPLVGRCDIER